jgi:hypothetical protein
MSASARNRLHELFLDAVVLAMYVTTVGGIALVGAH